MEDEEESVPNIRDNLTGILIISMLVSYLGYFQYGYAFMVVHNQAVLMNINITTEGLMHADYFWFILFPTYICFPAGGITGVVLFKTLVDKYGRKHVLLLNNTLTLFASAFLCISSTIGDFHFTSFATFTVGICSGIFSCCVPVYLLEISPAPTRGSLTATSVLFFNLGFLIGQMLGLPQILGNKKTFPLLVAVLGITATVCILLLLICPESPRFIFIQMKDETKARQVLRSLRVQEDVEDEIQELFAEDLYEYAANEKKMTLWKLLCTQKFRWPVVTITIMMAGSQFTGINGIIFYSTQVYKAVGLSEKNTSIISIGISIIVILTALAVINLIEMWGRRIPLIMGFMICSMTCILLTFTLEFQIYNPLIAYLSLIFIVIFLIGHTIGPAMVRNVILGELFLQSTRASAYTIGCCVMWFIRFFSVLILMTLQLLLGPYTLLVYWPFCVATFIYLFKMIPETKGKSFLEIQKFFTEDSAKQRKKKQLEIKESI